MDVFSTSTWGAIFLGILQGLTEFLPVSSSGHLVVFQQVIEVAGDDVLFDLVLHVGTLLPALWFYRADVRDIFVDAVSGEGPFWQRPGVRLGAMVLVATIPTAVMGVGLRDSFERIFHSPLVVSAAFLVTGFLLWSTRRLGEGSTNLANTSMLAALFVGVAQGIAITPGISRSGATIAVALLLGFEREFAVKLSFLMSVPAILGAVLIKSREVVVADVTWAPMLLGAAAATITGYAALVLLVRLVKVGRFADFAWYVWAMAIVTAGMVVFGVA